MKTAIPVVEDRLSHITDEDVSLIIYYSDGTHEIYHYSYRDEKDASLTVREWLGKFSDRLSKAEMSMMVFDRGHEMYVYDKKKMEWFIWAI